MGDDLKVEEKGIPEPPRFNVDDLPEPPKLSDNKEINIPNPLIDNSNDEIPPPPQLEENNAPKVESQKPLQEKKVETSLPKPPKIDEAKDTTSSSDIPLPPQLKKENKGTTTTEVRTEETIETVEEIKTNDPNIQKKELESLLPEPPKQEEPKKKKGGFFGLFKKKQKEDEDIKKYEESIVEKADEKIDLKPLSDEEFMPPLPPSAKKVEKAEDDSIKEIKEEDVVEVKSEVIEGTSPEWFSEGEEYEEKEELEEGLDFLREETREEEMLKEAESFIESADEDSQEESSDYEEEEEEITPVTDIHGVGPSRAKQLIKAGIKSAEEVAKHSFEELARKTKIPVVHTKKLVRHAKKIAKLKKDTVVSTKKSKKSETITDIIKQLETERKEIEKITKKEVLEKDLIELEGHKDLINVLENLEKKRNELIKLEAELSEREAKLNNHNESYKRDMQHIEQLKRRLDHDVRERTQYLINLEKEYFGKAQKLAKQQSDIEVKEKAMSEKEKYLNEKDTELKKRLSDLDDRSVTIEVKEKKLLNLMEELDKQDQVLKEKEDDLLSRETEYLKKLDIMEDHEKLVLRKLEEKRKDLERKEREISVREKKIQTKQRNVDKKSVEMEYAQNIFEEQKGKLIDDEFEQYLRDQLSGATNGMKFSDMQITKSINLPSKSHNDTIYNLIDTCRDLVKRDRVNEAKVFYNQLRERYYDGSFSDSEKENIHNMIRTLYDEINLADIGRNK